MNTAKYESPRILKSVLRQVPMQNLETVREKAKEAARAISFVTGNKIRARIIFRGQRFIHNMCTLKHEADSFDVYVKTILPRGFSKSLREEISEYNRKAVKSILLDMDMDIDDSL